MKRIAEASGAIAVAVAGILGILVSSADLAGVDISAVTKRSPDAMTLLLLGLIAFAIGVERLAFTRPLNSMLTDVYRLASRSAQIRRVHGSVDVYDEGMRLVRRAEGQVRTIVVNDPFKTPISYTRTAIARLKELDRNGRVPRYDVVIVANRPNLPPNFQELVEARLDLYKKHNVARFVRIYLLDQTDPIGMDCVIVDRRHASFAFASTAGTDALANAVIFENQPEIAEQYVDWFDQRVIPVSERIA